MRLKLEMCFDFPPARILIMNLAMVNFVAECVCLLVFANIN